MFICICWGEGWNTGDFVGDDEGLGICIPGMSPICAFLAGFVCADLLLFLRVALGLVIPGIFIPGMSIPGMLSMLCFFAVCFFLAGFLFFRGAAFDLGVGFALIIPGILDMSCP